MRRAEQELTGDADSPAKAREFARRVLQDWHWHETKGEIDLVVTELVSNAVLHGHGPICLTIELRGRCLRVGVRDANPAIPAPRTPGSDGGYGLGIVEAVCDKWHFEPIPGDGKIVWCECDRTSAKRP